jgi:hypothetical protein
VPAGSSESGYAPKSEDYGAAQRIGVVARDPVIQTAEIYSNLRPRRSTNAVSSISFEVGGYEARAPASYIPLAPIKPFNWTNRDSHVAVSGGKASLGAARRRRRPDRF